jgi:mono/diheme cytochrome c family protein
MKILLVALLLMPLNLAQAQGTPSPSGDAKAGQSSYRGYLCYFCHGDAAEGGFGPDLAGGRGLSLEQFKKQMRQPWGVMLAYTEAQMPDSAVANLHAYFKSLPPATELGEWHWRAAPASSPIGQRLYMNTLGCGQCHEPENKMGRAWLGEHAKEMSFDYFAKQIYNHTEKWPKGRMGFYSRTRVPPEMLRDIYEWMVEDLGVRASIGGALAVGEQQAGNTTYTLTLLNKGVTGSGATAEELTAFVKLPTGAKVVSGVGTGYKGAQSLASLGLEPGLPRAPHAHDDTGVVIRPKQDLSGDVIVWKIPKLAAAETLKLSFTLTGAPNADVVKGFDGSTVHWEKPGRTPAGSRLVYRDLRTPDKGDHERIALPRLP